MFDAGGDPSTAPAVRDWCGMEAAHPLRPYGSDPTIASLVVDGRAGCLVVPSADQAASLRREAEVVVDAPSGSVGPYRYLIVYADVGHVRDIAATIRFAPR